MRFKVAIEQAASACGALECESNHVGANCALRHLVLEVGYRNAGLLRYFRKRVEALVDELEQVLPHQLSRALNLTEDESKTV